MVTWTQPSRGKVKGLRSSRDDVGTTPQASRRFLNEQNESNFGRVNVQQKRPQDIDHLRRLATKLFTDGQYFHADLLLAELADLSEEDRAQIALRRAQIGLLGDRPDDASAQLAIARDEYGRHVYFVGLEADVAVRRGDLCSAVASLRQLGRHARADHLERFDGEWNQIAKLSGEPVTWDDTLPVPLVEVTVNDRAGRFVLDTGTGDCLLDSEFARRAGVEPGPYDQASFAGGHVGYWRLAKIENLHIGRSEFRKVPGMIASLVNAFHHIADARVDGIIGAGLLRAARGIDIEYQDARFTLGSPGVEDGEALWIAGPHYPLTSCRINGGPPSSWFIDSGMSGIELACSEAAARRYGALPLQQDVTGHGGGGSLVAKAFRIRHFQHAELEYPELPAAALKEFNLGRELGIRIGGIIGHNWLARHRVKLDYHTMQTHISID